MLTTLVISAALAKTQDPTVFKSAQQDVAMVLSNAVFKSYGDYNIVNVRQGELGESMAYFVRLEKPFSTTGDGLCFIFESPGAHTWTMQNKKPEVCKAGGTCSCN